jgi:hypothetical protein
LPHISKVTVPHARASQRHARQKATSAIGQGKARRVLFHHGGNSQKPDGSTCRRCRAQSSYPKEKAPPDRWRGRKVAAAEQLSLIRPRGAQLFGKSERPSARLDWERAAKAVARCYVIQFRPTKWQAATSLVLCVAMPCTPHATSICLAGLRPRVAIVTCTNSLLRHFHNQNDKTRITCVSRNTSMGEFHADADVSGCCSSANNDVADGSSPERRHGLTPTITGKMSLQIIFQSGDTATIRAMIRIHSFAVKSCAIRQRASLGDVNPLKRSRTWCHGVFGRAGASKLIRCRGGTLEVKPGDAEDRLALSAEHTKASLNIAHRFVAQ